MTGSPGSFFIASDIRLSEKPNSLHTLRTREVCALFQEAARFVFFPGESFSVFAYPRLASPCGLLI